MKCPIEDSVIAQQIVSRSFNNFYRENAFHSTSIIYKKSNERIENYITYLNERKRILSVIASGDQIINCILMGAKTIDAFDISVFPKYFLYLKLAAIKSLTHEQYIDFFYNQITPDEKYDDYYTLVRESLNFENREFWDSLFDYFSWFDIYNSTLFSSEVVTKKDVIRQNLYLQPEYYNQLKRIIDYIKINIFNGDICALADLLQENYDLIYLSNIIDYMNNDEYKKMLSKFNLNDSGIIITYLYRINQAVRKYFNEENYSFDEFDNTGVGVMVYRR